MLALAAALGLGLLVVTLGGPRTGKTGPAREAAPPAGESPSEALAAPGTTAAERDAGADPRPPEAARARAAAGNAGRFAPPVPAEEGILVLVVDEASQAPLPHAEVLWFDGDSVTDSDRSIAEAQGYDLDGLFERHGLRYRADGSGQVLVPRPSSSVVLAGRLDDLWGMQELRASEDGPARLELAFDPALKIRVVDEAGAPVAGVPVAMRIREEAGRAFDALKASTDGDGVGRIRHVKRLLDTLIENEVLAAISGVLPEPVEAPVDRDDFSKTIELVLPACGALDIRLVRPDGEPAQEVYRLSGEWHETGASEDAPRQERPLLAIEGGSARLFPVALSTSFRLSLHSLQRNEVLETDVDGPRRPGEVTLVQLEVSEASTLALRLVDDQGQPLADALLRLVLEEQQGDERPSSDRTSLRADQGGRVCYEVPGDYHGQRRRLQIRTHSLGDEPELTGELDLSYRLPVGETDAGDVVLSPPPLIVAGTVVDEAGAAIVGAMVHVVGVDLVDGREQQDSLWDLRRSTDGQGRFEIRGPFSHERLLLSAFHERYAPVGLQDVPPGATDARLVLRAAGELTARVLLDEQVDREWIHVRVASTDGGHRGAGGPEEDGKVEFKGLLPGSYVLEVVLHETEEVVLRTEPLQVGAGARTDAGELDLRDRLRVLRVTLVDEDGQPLHGRLCLVEPVADGRRICLGVEDGRGRLVTARDPLDVEVTAPGHRMVVVQNLQDEQTVALRRGPGVRVSLRGGLPRLEEGEVLSACLDGTEDGGRPAERTFHGFGEDGVAEARVAAPGEYRVTVFLDRASQEESWSAPVGGPFPLRVPEAAAPARIEVSLDAERLVRARRRQEER